MPTACFLVTAAVMYHDPVPTQEISGRAMTSFDDMKLEVGTRLQMTLKRGVQPLIYYTALIGYVSGEYLLMKIPLENGLSVPILAGERVALRVFPG
ncbi:flagellar brake domain-containing protein [Undibacterium arcticum]|uniref:flagellar brake domain-containing protein n=1 Tax=Undibacterium arcticum TaxID=1762892 RepID=UPI00361BE07C